MRRTLMLLAMLSLAATGCQSEREAEGREVEVTLDDVPAAVREAISRESGGAPVGKIAREDENGRPVYEAMITKDGKTFEVEFDETGKVLEREEVKGGDRED